MTFESVEIANQIKDRVDNRTRQMLGAYTALQFELTALTGNIHVDEDVVLDRVELSEGDRRRFDEITKRMRGLRSVISAHHPELMEDTSHRQAPRA